MSKTVAERYQEMCGDNLDVEMEALLRAAIAVSHSPDGRDGMAAVDLRWEPYESEWLAEASWANSERLIAMDLTPILAVRELRRRLAAGDRGIVEPSQAKAMKAYLAGRKAS